MQMNAVKQMDLIPHIHISKPVLIPINIAQVWKDLFFILMWTLIVCQRRLNGLLLPKIIGIWQKAGLPTIRILNCTRFAAKKVRTLLCATLSEMQWNG